ncbi:hypothetical protein [Rhizobium sp. Leaf386]|uniref:head-tail joining protein n=1 Tax=Rhizobium sp. Leaf386 TaxID=1736359 RepID=UPI000714BED3|nr:hypothetical protein [Rhizobium sp. Leaf386]KQS90303.1 hypothetical protein ASG50_07550 [Rhizobium sp. Leaf386]
MPVETDADLRLFINEDDWAVPCHWTSTGGATDFPAIFDAEYQLITSPFLDGGAEGSTPQITMCAVDVPALAAHGDAVIVNFGTVKAALYTVVEFKPDGTGMTVVRLQEAS